jgi:hypothetical protein
METREAGEEEELRSTYYPFIALMRPIIFIISLGVLALKNIIHFKLFFLQ